ncbi:MAG: ATP-binding cassette domain-containing protein [Symploca sp. SIO1C4]|uniref:ATP-binding cassette domain-containing protein n=1 Tax=Symploca sp. SIO1C4 TaxID=2607765 RepID=A0A6B3NCN0_9CYAN|nr:ATP-binding cassette domain-containing protein [Symploca sp. SIO1C4]
MFKDLPKVSYVLTGTRQELLLLLFVFALSSVLEAIGIGLVGPFLSLASNPNSIHKISLLTWTYRQLNLQSTSHFIPVIAIGIAIIFCIKSFLYFLARTYIFYFSFNQKKILMSRLLNSYLAVGYTFHLNKNTASLINNIIVETQQFTNGYILPLLNAVANFVVIFALLLLLAKTNSLLLVMILGVLLPTFLLFQRLGDRFKKWGKIRSQSNQGMIRVINHGLGGLKETRIIGCESYFQEQMNQEARNFARAATLFQSSQVLPRILIETALIIFLMLFISLSLLFFEQNIQDLTAVMGVFAIAAMRLIPATSMFVQSMAKMRNSSYALDMLYLDLKEIEKQEVDKIMKLRVSSKIDSSVISKKDDNQAMSFVNLVEMKNITYRYPGNSETAIENISLSIKKGQSIALIGKSGAGKTTLVDIILGLLEPESGDIQVDHVSIYDNLRSWQNLIGYIPQSIFLMDDTIERNIAFGVPDKFIDARKMNKAIKTAQLTELIEQLPNGIKTGIGERGVRLSGGQRQRIGIARALYHEREILVLDEATSALDSGTELLISEAINSLAGTKTLIIIAHRLSTVEHCDCVYMLEGGRIIQSGSYQEVVLEK